MATLLEFKCPSCGGALKFDSDIQMLSCPYCDSELDVEALRAYEEELSGEGETEADWVTPSESGWNEEEASSVRVYVCESCGGEIVAEETTSATLCPYCDNPVVVLGQISGVLRPDYVIPFKLNKQSAKEAFLRHLQGKRLLPAVFKSEAHIETIRGIYVPFWLFDADVDARVHYNATRVRCWSDSNYAYTETAHYSVMRGGEIGFSCVPVDGSQKMPDDLMESLEPYDFSEAVDFRTAYLAGYLADKYDVTAEQSCTRANERIRQSTRDAFASTVIGYTSVLPAGESIRIGNGKARYALYPVWILHTEWKGKRYLFAMNGQTGKFVGDLPLDKKAYHKWLWGLTAAISAAGMLLVGALSLL